MKKYIQSDKLKIANILNPNRDNENELYSGSICTFNSNFNLKLNKTYRWFYFTGYFKVVDECESNSKFDYDGNFYALSPLFYIYEKKLKYFSFTETVHNSYLIIENIFYNKKSFYIPDYLLSKINADEEHQLFSGKRTRIEELFMIHYGRKSEEMMDFEEEFLSSYNKMLKTMLSYCIKNDFLIEIDDEKI